MTAAPPPTGNPSRWPAPGRPSDDERARSEAGAAGASLGVDVGGSKVAIGLLDRDGHLIDSQHRPLASREYVTVLDLITDLADTLRARNQIHVSHAGVAVAGWLTADRSRLVAAVSLGWERRPLRDDLEERLGIPTVLHNDANAAAWAEWGEIGAPPDETFVLLTLGTDVGGGVIVGGQLLTGAHGIAGELGHIPVGLGDEACVCGASGCLAVYASGHSMLRTARDLLKRDPEQAPHLVRACAGQPDQLTGAALALAAASADPIALQVVERAARAIAAASAQISRTIDHRHLVLGGGVSDGFGETLASGVRHALAASNPLGPVLPHPHVRIAAFGNWAGVIGAALLAGAETGKPQAALAHHRTKESSCPTSTSASSGPAASPRPLTCPH